MESKKITSVSEYLIHYLRTEIITGGLAPDEKINEYQLSKMLDVSRPILREVLRTLESEGLVVNIPRKGSHVSNISLEDFIELYEIRQMIECKAIDLLKDRNIRKVPKIYQTIKKESTLKVPSVDSSSKVFLKFFETGLRFHSLLIEVTGNKRLSQFYKGIQYNLLRYHVFQGAKNLEANIKVNHSELAAELEKGEFTKAKRDLHGHIKVHGDIIKKNLKLREKS